MDSRLRGNDEWGRPWCTAPSLLSKRERTATIDIKLAHGVLDGHG